MAKVFYIPYAKYELNSELSQEELIGKLRSQISNYNLVSELTTKNKAKFSGAIHLKTGEFRIKKRINYINNLNPTLRGRIVKEGTRSKILVTLKLPVFSYIFLMMFCVGWTLLGFLGTNAPEDLILPIGGWVTVYVLTFFGFNMGGGAALDALYELV